jgi:hypothetical protein
MADFNCECEETSEYATLLALRTRMMVELGFAAQAATPPPGMALLLDSWLRGAQTQLYKKNPSLRTERYFRWTMLEGEGYYGIRDNDTPEDFEDITCAKQLNEYEITGVWLEDLNGSWTPLYPGIPAELYTTVDQLGYPSRFEIRSCIEVFPRPNTDGLKLWIRGQMGLEAFVEDSDKTTIDDELVFLWALAKGKAHYGKKDKTEAKQDAITYLLDTVSGKHGTKRYIPRAAPPPVDVRPVMTVYNTGP